MTLPALKSLNHLLAFLNLYLFISEIKSILEPCDQTGHTHFFTMLTPKMFNHLLIFVIMYQQAKNQLIPSVHSSDTINLRVLPPDWPHPFLAMLTPKIFKHFLICVKLYMQKMRLFRQFILE